MASNLIHFKNYRDNLKYHNIASNIAVRVAVKKDINIVTGL